MATTSGKGIGSLPREGAVGRVFGIQIRFAATTLRKAYRSHIAARGEGTARRLAAAANLSPKTVGDMSLSNRLFANFYPATKRKPKHSGTIGPKTRQKP